MRWLLTLSSVILTWFSMPSHAVAGDDAGPIEDRVMHGYADSNGVRIHFAALGDADMPLVLMIHGLEDQAFVPETLNDTWRWVEKDFTLVTIPGAGHFVQQDAADLVTGSIVMWLRRDSASTAR